jgi:hypothetical protein
MTRTAHTIFVSIMVFIVVATLLILVYFGISYYQTGMEERFFHVGHNQLKPSGIIGHGLGILGTLLMILGILLYMFRKRLRIMARWGTLKYWLEFHIFLCTLGPILVLFHTSFKFGGIVAISFWSMVAVFLSGIIGRFIYIQIPRTIEGRELSLNEVREMQSDVAILLKSNFQLDDQTYQYIISAITKTPEIHTGIRFGQYLKKYFNDFRTIQSIKSKLKKSNCPNSEYKKIIALIKRDVSLNRKIERLVVMQKLFIYWHVAHLPFALVMLIIMVIHVAVTIVFGYKWIF